MPEEGVELTTNDKLLNNEEVCILLKYIIFE